MEQHSVFIAAAPDAVWSALHDPETLRRALPGCEAVNRKGPKELQVKAAIEIAFFRRVVTGALRLNDEVPGEKLRMNASVGERAKGVVHVQLTPENAGTRLTYRIKADVKMKVAGLGDFIINRTAQKLGGQFFKAIGSEVTKPA